MLRLIKLIIWVGVICAIIFYINYKDFLYIQVKETKTISVNSWDTLVSTLTRELGYNELFLKIYLHLHPEKKIHIQAWDFRILKWDSIDGIIETMKHGAITTDIKLTLLEGWNIFDIDEYLVQKELIEAGSFIQEAQNIEKYMADYPFLEKALSLEWYLYPDTYFVNPNDFQLEKFNILLLNNFKQKIYIPLLSPLSAENINELIILASIVEKEERNISQKSTVAGILIKRYKQNWMIGADITACYAYELTSEECRKNLSKYIADKNEYNTRTMVGLPKTPINNPNIESIKASLNPKHTEYWYYLHDTESWQIYYAKTNEEHNRNKQLYLK